MRREIITCDHCGIEVKKDFSEYTSVYFNDFNRGKHEPQFCVSFKIEAANLTQDSFDLCKDCAQKIIKNSRIIMVD